jgi:uncharacterized membrane protein
MKSTSRFAYAALALAGYADATYLAVKHLYRADAGCLLSDGCDTVLNSEFSSIFGIPLAFLGYAYYLICVIGITAYFQSGNAKILNGLFLVNLSGFAFSLWLVYLQAFVLNAFCTWCLFSAAVTTLLVAILALRKE